MREGGRDGPRLSGGMEEIHFLDGKNSTVAMTWPPPPPRKLTTELNLLTNFRERARAEREGDRTEKAPKPVSEVA